jgi:S-adenosylmethionine hydrolase
MSGFPIRPSRAAFGPKPVNRRPVRNPAQEMDGPTVGDLLMWQTSGMGDEIEDYKRFALPRPKEVDGLVKGVILRADAFGNLITNLRQEDLPESVAQDGAIKLQAGTQAVSLFVETFAQGNGTEPFAYLGSSGFVEIGVNKGSAARTLGLARGTAVVLTK